MLQLGKLKEVEVRSLWKHEQYDFSDWLAKPENVEYLNDILGLSLVNIEREAIVGKYRCDLCAHDETSNETVIIENQLETSNHDHLGKIITYASCLDASVIVWIVKDASEEHRSAIEWLNNNTNEGIGFFLIEIHVYEIGDSLPAPMFKVIEQPNDFIKAGKRGVTENGSMSRSSLECRDFWLQMNDALPEYGNPFNKRKAMAQHWYDVAVGRSDCHIGISLVNKEGKINIEFYIPDNKDLFDHLEAHKQAIEEVFGHQLDWNRLEGKKASKITHTIDGLDFDDQSNYADLIQQIMVIVPKMRSAFKGYI